jgi:hypothetical protein
MAFQTGVVNTCLDLGDALRIFAEADGWVIDRWTDEGTDWWWLQLHKGTVHNTMIFGKTNELIQSRGCTSYDSGLSWNAQPGSTSYGADWSKTNILYEPFTNYWFFSGPIYIHVVVETNPSYFAHFGIGQISKYGAYDGGEYYYGTEWYTSDIDDANDDYHRTPFSSDSYAREHSYFDHGGALRFMEGNNSTSNGWALFSQYTDRAFRGVCTGGYCNRAQALNYRLYAEGQITSFNLSQALIPIVSTCERQDGGFSILGEPFDMRQCNISYNDPASIWTIGTDEWYLFPLKCKTYINAATSYSGSYGLAYRKNV